MCNLDLEVFSENAENPDWQRFQPRRVPARY